MKFFKQNQLSVLRIYGDDTVRYLNGRITQDVKTLKLNETRLSLLLTPQGKIDGKFSITKRESDFLIISETSEEFSEEIFIKNLLKFKVADQVFVESLNDYRVFTFYSDKSREDLELLASDSNFLKIKRGNSLTFDLITKDDLPKEILNTSEASTEEDYLRFRINSKFPILGYELTLKSSGTDIPLSDYVSFTKGCYAGQEVVEMSQARGRANKKLVFIQGDFSIENNLSDYKIIDSGSKKELGFVTSALNIASDNTNKNFIALGFVKNDSNPDFDYSLLINSEKEIPIKIDATT